MITLQEVVNLLIKEDLLREFVVDGIWYYTFNDDIYNQKFDKLTYFSGDANEGTLYFCKGLNFKRSYLKDALKRGASAYIAEALDDEYQKLAIIVNDIQKSMAVIARYFYDYPDLKLKTIGITGTKGKTTTAYMIRHILARQTNNKVAQLSSEMNILDGKTAQPAKLTTPESLDLFKMMRIAVDAGMEYLVMEVSSQAYKLNRVYGITYDYGIFLNISPDHISPIEHPTFDDYFSCKLELLKNVKQLIVNNDSSYAKFICSKASNLSVPYITYGENEADYLYTSKGFEFQVHSTNSKVNELDNIFTLSMPGEFNQSNAVAAIILSLLCKVSIKNIEVGLKETIVPGRMEKVQSNNPITVYIDYAHNYLSLKSSLDFLRSAYPKARVIAITGSIGGKGLNRRYDLGRAMSEVADVAIVTSEDSMDEDPLMIMEEIAKGVTNPDVKLYKIVNRSEAIKTAIEIANPQDVILIAGKGREAFLKVKGQMLDYPGDYKVAKKYLEQ